MTQPATYVAEFQFGDYAATIRLSSPSADQQQHHASQQEQSTSQGRPLESRPVLRLQVDHNHTHTHTHFHTHRHIKYHYRSAYRQQQRSERPSNVISRQSHVVPFQRRSTTSDPCSRANRSGHVLSPLLDPKEAFNYSPGMDNGLIVIAAASLLRLGTRYLTACISHSNYLRDPVERLLLWLSARPRYWIQQLQISMTQKRLRSHAVEILAFSLDTDSDSSDDDHDPPAPITDTHPFPPFNPSRSANNAVIDRRHSFSNSITILSPRKALGSLVHHIHHAHHHSLPSFPSFPTEAFATVPKVAGDQGRQSDGRDVIPTGDQSPFRQIPARRARAMSKPTTPCLNAPSTLALQRSHRATLSAPAGLGERLRQAYKLRFGAPVPLFPVSGTVSRSVLSNGSSRRGSLTGQRSPAGPASVTYSEHPEAVAIASPVAAVDLFSWKVFPGDLRPSGQVCLYRLLAMRIMLGIPPRLDRASRLPLGVSPWALIRAIKLHLVQSSSELGHGNFGCVRLCKHIPGIVGPVAVKTMLLNKLTLDGWVREAAMSAEMAHLRSENSVTFHGMVFTMGPQDGVYGHLLMGVAEEGTLESYIRKLDYETRLKHHSLLCSNKTRHERGYSKLFNRTSDASNIISLLIDVTGDLIALRDCGVVHNDLKLDNILVKTGQIVGSSPPRMRAAVTDFGHVVFLPNTAAPGAALTITAPEGLPNYTSAGTCSFASDKYSLGLVLFEAVQFCAEPFARFTPEVMKMARALMSQEISKRPSLEQVQQLLHGAGDTMLHILSQSRYKYPASQLKGARFPRCPTVRLFPAPKDIFQTPCPPDSWLAFKNLGSYVAARSTVIRTIYDAVDVSTGVQELPYFPLYKAYEAVGLATSLGPFIRGVCGYKSGQVLAPRLKDMDFKLIAVAKTMSGIKALQGLAGSNIQLDLALSALLQEAS